MRNFNKFKKLLAILLSVAMCLSFTTIASANDDARVDEPTRQAIGPIIATGAGTISLNGIVEVHLTSPNAWADIQVGSAESDDPGSISCSVTFPNGTAYNLGNILASGGLSSAREFSWCPEGTYTFCFYTSMNVPHLVWANIYD